MVLLSLLIFSSCSAQPYIKQFKGLLKQAPKLWTVWQLEQENIEIRADRRCLMASAQSFGNSEEACRPTQTLTTTSNEDTSPGTSVTVRLASLSLAVYLIFETAWLCSLWSEELRTCCAECGHPDTGPQAHFSVVECVVWAPLRLSAPLIRGSLVKGISIEPCRLCSAGSSYAEPVTLL